MAIYAVGDIQGCLGPLKKLLKKVRFDQREDVLWCVGDLVNRGPKSLETLRYLKSLGDACVCVLGNHDLHLLELAAGGERYRRDSLADVLDAPDCDELIEWLRHRPLLHHDKKLGWTMVHAGLHPEWNLKTALTRAAAVEKKLQGKKWKKFCLKLHHAVFPDRDPPQGDKQQLIFTTAVMTQARFCTSDGYFNWKVNSGVPRNRRKKAWFSFSRLAWQRSGRIVYGHWAARGLVLDQLHVLGLDSGCVWGGSLTLAELGKRGHSRIAAVYKCKSCGKPVRRGKKKKS